MICVAISNNKLQDCLKTLEQVDMAEIRLDLTGFAPSDFPAIFGHKTPTVATCRPDELGLEKQSELLIAAIEAGANYVDIEIEAPKEQQQAILDIARGKGCQVIVSYHNYEKTPGLRELYQIVDECYDLGADVAKLATACHNKHDSARILSLYSIQKPIVALGMGEAGKITRIMAPQLGAEFTFAAADDGSATAPGQITYTEMKKCLNQINETINSHE